MANHGTVPVADTKLLSYMAHFASKIDAHASVLAITQEDIATLKADAAMVGWVLGALPALRATLKSFTAFKDHVFDDETKGAPAATPTLPTLPTAPAAVPAGLLPRTRALVQRIKKSPGYTEAIGKDLGIVGPEATADSNPKPSFRATGLPGSEVRLDWVKAGHSGVVIQGKRPGDADWVMLGKDNYSPYVDGRPPVAAGQPETRQYRMRYLDRDDEVGEWSDTVSVVTVA